MNDLAAAAEALNGLVPVNSQSLARLTNIVDDTSGGPYGSGDRSLDTYSWEKLKALVLLAHEYNDALARARDALGIKGEV